MKNVLDLLLLHLLFDSVDGAMVEYKTAVP